MYIYNIKLIFTFSFLICIYRIYTKVPSQEQHNKQMYIWRKHESTIYVCLINTGYFYCLYISYLKLGDRK